VNNYLKQYKVGFSIYGLIAFALQEIPYLPWFLLPLADNPLANNIPKNMLFGTLEKFGGVLTVALSIIVINKSLIHPKFNSRFFLVSAFCLIAYYVCWIFYFSGFTNAWLIVIGLSAIVPIYYFFIALWLRNYFAVFVSIIFFIGHTGSNIINFLIG